MYSLIQLKTLVSCGRDPARSLPLRRGFLLIPLILVCFAFSPKMQAEGEVPFSPSNTQEGFNALNLLTTGGFNTGLGWYSLGFNLTDGSFNTAVGAGSLDLNNGNSNTAAGTGALLLNIVADRNTAVGTDALIFNDFTSTFPSTATDNTAVGFWALFSNHDGGLNTAVGSAALFFNDSAGTLPATAFFNDAVGANALFSNVDGNSNNAFGESALFWNGIASANTAIGDVALVLNDFSLGGTANFNTGVGWAVMANNDGGGQNTVVGAGAGLNLVFGGSNTYVGQFVGALPIPDEDLTIRIADFSIDGFGSAQCYIGGIWNNFQALPSHGGSPSVVVVTLDLADDHLGWDVIVSPNEGGSTPSVPSRGAPQLRSAPQPHARPSAQHQAMLNDKVEKLQATVAQQQTQIDTLTAQLREQADQIQKVSAQLEMVKPAPRVVENR